MFKYSKTIKKNFIKILNSKKAVFVLGLDSFAEALFWPIPPAVFLAPLCVAFPKRVWFYALIVTICGCIGNSIMYLLGVFCSTKCIELYTRFGGNISYLDESLHILKGSVYFFMPTFAAFVPIPYKISCFAIGIIAGEKINSESSSFLVLLTSFIISSNFGRYIRFYLESLFFAYGFGSIIKMLNILKRK